MDYDKHNQTTINVNILTYLRRTDAKIKRSLSIFGIFRHTIFQLVRYERTTIWILTEVGFVFRKWDRFGWFLQNSTTQLNQLKHIHDHLPPKNGCSNSPKLAQQFNTVSEGGPSSYSGNISRRQIGSQKGGAFHFIRRWVSNAEHGRRFRNTANNENLVLQMKMILLST